MTQSRFLQQFRAVFEPARRDDLRPGAEGFIGRECVWQYSWVIEKDEFAGQYAGQWACMLIEPWPAPFLWAAEVDLRVTRASDSLREGGGG